MAFLASQPVAFSALAVSPTRQKSMNALTELMMQAIGPQAQPFVAVDGGKVDAFESRLSPRYFNLRKASIYAGSNEIQRNIIAKMTLGL